MTKEEQRFQAAAAAMQALLSDLSVFEYDQIAYSAVKMSDALIKELDNDSKKASIGINDLPYIESFPSKNRNSKKTPDPITEPSMITICDIKLRK